MILLPLPKWVKRESGNFVLGLDAMIVIGQSCPEGISVYAGMLREEIAACTGFETEVTRGRAKRGDILLDFDSALRAEQYRLEIGAAGVVLHGGSLHSLGYGVQTLRQLVRQYAGLLPFLRIEDEPDFEARGFFHDVTRGRVQTLPNLKKLADTMAFYKLNQLQLYIEHTYLFRDMPELWRDETPLTSGEILELDEYCHMRGIELVPCLASFGHLYKLLSTRTYERLCELEGSAGQEFSFWDRMAHHTLNPVDPKSAELIYDMIGEFMQLFRSDKFNICADETFDLGTGRSREAAEKQGKEQLYADFVSGLFDYLIGHGKTPMFWGDIICGSPERLKAFPKEVICLAWGYSEQQQDTEIRTLHEAGTKLYVCPGTRGWNHWVNQLRHSYENIRRMCGYGRKYGAAGVLNTDWGDYGHINHPVFSVPAMIYGAVFSWGNVRIDFDELNRQISILEFGDASGSLAGCLARVSDTAVFGWEDAVMMKEWAQKGRDAEEILQKFRVGGEGPFEQANRRAEELLAELYRAGRQLDFRSRPVIACAAVALKAISVWNEVGKFYVKIGEAACRRAVNVRTAPGGGHASGEAEAGGIFQDKAGTWKKDGALLADELERCLCHFKTYWRQNSREGDLSKISEVFFWHADLLRS